MEYDGTTVTFSIKKNDIVISTSLLFMFWLNSWSVDVLVAADNLRTSVEVW